MWILLLWFLKQFSVLRVNSLWPSDTIYRHRSESNLAQVMACYLMAPIHYLNQCWLTISGFLWHSPDRNFTGNAQDICPWYQFKKCKFKITATSPGGSELMLCILIPLQLTDWEISQLNQHVNFEGVNIDPAPHQVVERASLYRVSTVRCRYNAVNFPRFPHIRHPIACPSGQGPGQGMGCLSWVSILIYGLLLSVQCCV